VSSDGAPLRVALTTLGCKVNFAEMAELAGALAAAGCDVVPEHEPADVRVLNSCTVTTQADATTRQRLRRLRRSDPGAHLVLTGCSVDANPHLYPSAQRRAAPLPIAAADAVFTNADKEKIADHIASLATSWARPSARPRRQLRARAFIKIQDGCDHRCTYCIVWKARGRSRSVAPATVMRRARQALQEGHAELVLCGVDLGSYGRDVDASLPALLERLLDMVGEHARIRLSSINANDVTPALIAFNKHPRLCSHWHMPLQSGSDAMLRAMHRGYRRRQYLRVVQELRNADPATEFTTDVMVGFPGETDHDHEQTISLIEEVGFLGCHVFRWSSRPGTPAANLPGSLADATARRRSAEARRAAARTGHASRQRACGRVHEVVWDSIVEAQAHGVAATYHEVVTGGVEGLRAGTLSSVRALTVEGDHLRGIVQPA
jgi:threonylcarbamoyladenosine tRNA methylthiotransferase MtaB